MEKFGSTRYNSRWDGWTWFILGLVAACCVAVRQDDFIRQLLSINPEIQHSAEQPD